MYSYQHTPFYLLYTAPDSVDEKNLLSEPTLQPPSSPNFCLLLYLHGKNEQQALTTSYIPPPHISIDSSWPKHLRQLQPRLDPYKGKLLSDGAAPGLVQTRLLLCVVSPFLRLRSSPSFSFPFFVASRPFCPKKKLMTITLLTLDDADSVFAHCRIICEFFTASLQSSLIF